MKPKSPLIAFLIPLCAALLIVAYYYQNRKTMMADLAKSGVSAIYDGGNVSLEDIRQYFVHPPSEEGSLLRVLEVTPEDLADLDKEEASRLKEPSMQLLLSLVIQHIAAVKYLNTRDWEYPREVLTEAVKIYKHSLMADRMEEELRKIDPLITPEEMMQYYIKNRNEFHREGKRLTRHLMLNQDESAAIHSTTKEIWQRIHNGEDFAALIQHYSQSESKNRSGVLGWHPKGALHLAFEQAIWSMEIGEITGPLQINETLHFVHLMDAQEKGLMGFEESKPHIQEVLDEQKRKEQLYSLLNIPNDLVEQGHVESTLEYQTQLLNRAYQNNLDRQTDIVQQVHVYEMYKRADLLFNEYVEKYKKNQRHPVEQETRWVIENQALKQLLNKINFSFIVKFNLPEKETNTIPNK